MENGKYDYIQVGEYDGNYGELQDYNYDGDFLRLYGKIQFPNGSTNPIKSICSDPCPLGQIQVRLRIQWNNIVQLLKKVPFIP